MLSRDGENEAPRYSAMSRMNIFSSRTLPRSPRQSPDSDTVIPEHEKVDKILIDENAHTPRPCDSSEDRIYDETSEDGFYYPEGGLRAWIVVFGAFCLLFAGLGMINIVGVFQAYLIENQLKGYDESTVSWISSIYVFLTFFLGLEIGPIFDAKGPRVLVFIGSVCLVISTMLLGLCTEYWHFILDFSILGGIGSAFIFTPSFSAIAHYFKRRRGTATGIAATGGACGGLVFPLMLQPLFSSVGFAWATRILGFLILFLCIVGNLLVRSRLPPKQGSSILPDFRIFLDGTGAMALTTAGVWLLEWGVFTPVTYLTTYAIANGIDEKFSYQLIAIFQAGSIFGRFVPGMLADRWGRFNTMIVTLLLCLITTFAFWLPAHGNIPLLVLFSVGFGFASGSNISLTPICVGQLCEVQHYGRYYATCYTVVSFGTLTGIPIAGALIRAAGGQYWGVILFTGLCYVGSMLCFVWVKVRRCGWRPQVKW